MYSDTDKIAEWNGWLNTVGDEIHELAHMDDVFWQLQAIFSSNASIPESATVRHWIGTTYINTIAIGLRRLVDRKKGSQSLIRLLNDMASHCTLLTRTRYVELHEASVQEEAFDWFSELAAGDHEHIPRARLRAMAARLDSAFKKVSSYASERVAHNTRKPRKPVNFEEVRLALVDAYLVYAWCSLVMNSVIQENLVPVIQADWLAAFTVPWIEAGTGGLEYRHLDEVVALVSSDRPV